MAITVGGTSITFNDGTTQTTAGGAPTTAQVLSATAGASVGAVGTYALCVGASGSSSPLNPGSTVAGSQLRYAACNGDVYGTPPSGTWRTMGFMNFQYGAGNAYSTTMFLRIS